VAKNGKLRYKNQQNAIKSSKKGGGLAAPEHVSFLIFLLQLEVKGYP